MKIELDDYQAINLKHFLEKVKIMGNTGDWFHEILFKLENVTLTLQPNPHSFYLIEALKMLEEKFGVK